MDREWPAVPDSKHQARHLSSRALIDRDNKYQASHINHAAWHFSNIPTAAAGQRIVKLDNLY